MCLKVADHGGSATEKAQAYFALVGLLARVDAEVVGELTRMCEMLAAKPAAIHFFPKPRTSTGVAVQYESSRKRDAPVSHFVLQVEAHAQVETCFTRAARLQRRGGG